MFLELKKGKDTISDIIFLIFFKLWSKNVGRLGKGRGQGHPGKPICYSFSAHRDESIGI